MSRRDGYGRVVIGGLWDRDEVGVLEFGVCGHKLGFEIGTFEVLS